MKKENDKVEEETSYLIVITFIDSLRLTPWFIYFLVYTYLTCKTWEK